jgi:hypothetical protein
MCLDLNSMSKYQKKISHNVKKKMEFSIKLFLQKKSELFRKQLAVLEEIFHIVLWFYVCTTSVLWLYNTLFSSYFLESLGYFRKNPRIPLTTLGINRHVIGTLMIEIMLLLKLIVQFYSLNLI